MSEHDCTACAEYNRLSRRGFLQLSGAALAMLGVPEGLPRGAFARASASTRDVVILVYLGGGAEGLTLCAPYGDPAYATLRSQTRIMVPDGTAATAQALSNSNFFGLP